MQKFKLGSTDAFVSPLGVGCMGMSGVYGQTSEEEGEKTIQEALAKGLNLLNTGDFYGVGHNELLIARAIKGLRQQAFISVKFGALRAPGGGWLGIDTRPQAVKNSLSYSLTRLGTDYVDLYQPCRVDPHVPIEETVGAIAEMVKAGYVKHVGLSEANGKTLRRAHAVHPIAAVEVEYSLMDKHIESDLLPVARELGVAVIAYGVLSRGLLQNQGQLQIKKQDYRAHLPRFNGENLQKNLTLVQKLQEMADKKGATVSQIAIAWVRSQGDDIFPLLGAKTRDRLNEGIGSLQVKFSQGELALLTEWFAPGVTAGDRYNADQMAFVNA